MNLVFLVYCPAVRHLQGLSWPLQDCFVFVCLSLGPERREWDSKRKEKKKRPFHFLDWSLKRVALTCHDSNSIISATLSRHWPYKWCCGLPPYAIRHGVKQDGVLSPLICAAASVAFTPCPHLSEKKSRLQRQFSLSLWWFSSYTVFFFSPLFLPCLCFIASCECWSEASGSSFPNRCLGAYHPRLCPYLWPSASCILSLACLRVGIYFT